MKQILKAIILSVIVSGCSKYLPENMQNYFSPAEEKLEGKRVSVLTLDSKLLPDATAKDIVISIPPQEENDSWELSANYQTTLPENFALASRLTSSITGSITPPNGKIFGFTATPVIAGAKMFVINGKGEIEALYADNPKKRIWVRSTIPAGDEKKQFAGGGIVYHEGGVYVTAGHRDVVALNAENGKELWRYTLKNISRSAPLVSQDSVYVMTIDNRLYSLNILDGTIKWVHESAEEAVGIFGAASMAVQDGAVIIPYSSGLLYSLDAKTGQEIWGVNLAYVNNLDSLSVNDIDISPVVKNGKIYVAGNMGMFYIIDQKDGNLMWQKPIKAIKSIWVAGNFVYILNSSHELICIHSLDSKVVWVKNLYSMIEDKKDVKFNMSGPILAGDNLVLTSSSGRMIFLSPTSGELIKRIEIFKNVNLMPVIAHKKIFILSDDGKIGVWY